MIAWQTWNSTQRIIKHMAISRKDPSSKFKDTVSTESLSHFAAVQSLSPVPLFVTPWTAALRTPLSSTISRSLLRFMSIESVMLSNLLILCHRLLLLPSIFLSISFFQSPLHHKNCIKPSSVKDHLYSGTKEASTVSLTGSRQHLEVIPT